MSTSEARRTDQAELFDLPLDRPPDPVEREDSEASQDVPPAERSGSPPDLSARLYAGCVDLLVHAGLLLLLLLGLLALGLDPGIRHTVALGGVLLIFSLFYTVIPLVFWSATPGMRLRGLAAYNDRDEERERLTLAQAVGRWAGALLTVASAGLLLAMAWRGRSLADRLTGSTTVVV